MNKTQHILIAAVAVATLWPLAPVAHADPPDIANCPVPIMFGKCPVAGWENATIAPTPAPCPSDLCSPRPAQETTVPTGVIDVVTPKLPDGRQPQSPCDAYPPLCAGTPHGDWKVTSIPPSALQP